MLSNGDPCAGLLRDVVSLVWVRSTTAIKHYIDPDGEARNRVNLTKCYLSV